MRTNHDTMTVLAAYRDGAMAVKAENKELGKALRAALKYIRKIEADLAREKELNRALAGTLTREDVA